jgi:hypothetical protein
VLGISLGYLMDGNESRGELVSPYKVKDIILQYLAVTGITIDQF